MSNQLVFNGIVFNSYDHHGQSWLSSNELCVALQYADEKSINRIYQRHADEFTDSMTSLVKLTPSEKSIGYDNLQSEIRIFSVRGAHLIAMFARTPVAKDFRHWALDILDREASQTPLLTAAPTYPCRILHTFNEHGVIVGARIAEPDEDLTSPKNFAETLKKRGYALVRIEEFAGIIA